MVTPINEGISTGMVKRKTALKSVYHWNKQFSLFVEIEIVLRHECNFIQLFLILPNT